MIYDELKNYLTQTASPELVALFDRAVTLFDSLDMDDYMFSFDAVMGEATSGVTEEIIDRLTSTLDELLDTLLKQHGVVMAETTTLDTELTVLEGLMLVQNWEDKAGLSLLLESEQSSEEVFAELMSYLTGVQTENLLLELLDVDKALLNRIREEFACASDMTEAVEEVQQQVTDYAKVRGLEWPCFLKFDRLVKYFGFLKQPFALYLKSYMVEHNVGPSRDSAEAVYLDWAQELVVLAAISEEGLAKALPLVRENMTTLTTDLNVSTKLDLAVVKTLAEVSSVKS